MTIRFEILYRYLKVRNLLVENGYIKSNEIQKVMWNDTNHDSLLRVLPKRKTYTIKKTFSLVSMKDYFRIIMALVTHLDLELYQMDIKIAFLNGELDETIYMVQQSHFEMEDPNGMICQLKKSIYELKQASRQW
jgi:Reverse transcriptase (RNA-dependent DNA polymerase)